MSVDVSARLGYGYMLSNDEYRDYQNRLEEKGYDTPDFCFWVNSYSSDSDVFFGVNIDGTRDYTSLSLEDLEVDERKWEEVYKIWCEDFPEKKDELPNYYLICQWW